MRQGQQHNRRGRGRSRKPQNPMVRSYESNGPDVKIRGNPQHIAEKYLTLARDAQSSSDPVLAENYLQHAEHYIRIIMSFRDQQPANGANGGRRPFGAADYDDGDEFGDDEGDDLAAEVGGLARSIDLAGSPQPDIASDVGGQGSERGFHERGGSDRQPYDRNVHERQGGDRFGGDPQSNERHGQPRQGSDRYQGRSGSDRQGEQSGRADRGGNRGNYDNRRDRRPDQRGGEQRGHDQRGGEHRQDRRPEYRQNYEPRQPRDQSGGAASERGPAERSAAERGPQEQPRERRDDGRHEVGHEGANGVEQPVATTAATEQPVAPRHRERLPADPSQQPEFLRRPIRRSRTAANAAGGDVGSEPVATSPATGSQSDDDVK